MALLGGGAPVGTSQPDPTDHFHFADKFVTHPLAYKLDSLVRVTRREVQVRQLSRY